MTINLITIDEIFYTRQSPKQNGAIDDWAYELNGDFEEKPTLNFSVFSNE